MRQRELHSPQEVNLGKDCLYWTRVYEKDGLTVLDGCAYAKAELQNRVSCEGVVDDICLFIIHKRIPGSLTEEQLLEIKTRVPSIGDSFALPPGDIK